ncbi:MAG: S8 family serine peptidase [Methylococcaceae bacterium]|nr:S8 family serine peptidase [Methylococcaceae bacterium]
MNKILPLLLVSMVFAVGATSVKSEELIPPQLMSLYQQQAADQMILVAFSDQSIDTITDLAGGNAYRKRGDYQSTTWSQRVTDQIAAEHQLIKITEWPMTEVGMHCAVYQVTPNLTMTDALQQLAKDARVELVQPMHYFKTEAHQYNDPYFKLQANMQQMQINQAHTKSTGRQITIAMIDTGVALDHPDLIGQISHNENFAKDISASFNSDKHGTAVAGVMVAKKDNNTGITGVAPDAKLIALKACWPDQVDAMAAVCNSLTLALAVNAAIKAEADILNMSLTGPDDPLLTLLLNKAIEKGILVVAASTGTDKNNEGFPASLKNVIAVQSLIFPQQAKISVSAATKAAVVTAPGEKILTTLPQGSYDFISGSSIAAAEVSGVIALLMELKPDLNLAETQKILQKSALPAIAGAVSGINAGTALLALCEMTTCPQETVSLVMDMK